MTLLRQEMINQLDADETVLEHLWKIYTARGYYRRPFLEGRNQSDGQQIPNRSLLNLNVLHWFEVNKYDTRHFKLNGGFYDIVFPEFAMNWIS